MKCTLCSSFTCKFGKQYLKKSLVTHFFYQSLLFSDNKLTHSFIHSFIPQTFTLLCTRQCERVTGMGYTKMIKRQSLPTKSICLVRREVDKLQALFVKWWNLGTNKILYQETQAGRFNRYYLSWILRNEQDISKWRQHKGHT